MWNQIRFWVSSCCRKGRERMKLWRSLLEDVACCISEKTSNCASFSTKQLARVNFLRKFFQVFLKLVLFLVSNSVVVLFIMRCFTIFLKIQTIFRGSLPQICLLYLRYFLFPWTWFVLIFVNLRYLQACLEMLQDSENYLVESDELKPLVEVHMAVVSAMIGSQAAAEQIVHLWNFIFLSHPAAHTYITYGYSEHFRWLQEG